MIEQKHWEGQIEYCPLLIVTFIAAFGMGRAGSNEWKKSPFSEKWREDPLFTLILCPKFDARKAKRNGVEYHATTPFLEAIVQKFEPLS